MQASGKVANGIGQPVRRKEDFRLLTGRGSFADDVVLPRLAHAVHRALAPCACPHRRGRQGGGARRARRARGADRRRLPRRRARPDPAQSRADRPARRRGAATRRPADRHPPLPAAGRQGALCRRAGRPGRRRDHRRGQGCRRTGRDHLRAAAGGGARRRCGGARRADACGTRRRAMSASTSRSATRPRPPRPSRAPRMSCGSTPGRSASPACRWSRARSPPNTTRRAGCYTLYTGSGRGVAKVRPRPRAGARRAGGAGARASAATWAAISARAISSIPNMRCSPGRRAASAGRSNGPASAARRFSATIRAAT